MIVCGNKFIHQLKNESREKLSNEGLPEWISIYYVAVQGTNFMKCNLCDIELEADSKSPILLEHMKTSHKDVHDLHKDNPEATVGFRIEFLHLNMLKDDGALKAEPVILGEVCEATTEPIVENILEPEKEKDEINMKYVMLPKKKRESGEQRKRSWVWKYFEKLSNIIYRCTLCSVVLSIKGCNTNNMNRHVRTRHPNIFNQEIRKRDSTDNLPDLTREVETPYAIITEEIYASDRDQEEPIDSPTQKMRRSWIWSYFDRVSSTQAQCKLCKRQICHGGNATGNMNRHLKMIHHKTSYDSSWVWKVFENVDDMYSCKICQYRCMKKNNDPDKTLSNILHHLKMKHGVVSVRFGFSNRGHLVIHIGAYKFIKHECYKKKIRWTCCKRIQLGCKANVTTDNSVIVRSYLAHNHT